MSLISIISLILRLLCSVGRFPSKYERFRALYVANHVKTRNRRQGVVADVDDTRQCPFVEHYDGNLHDVLANLCRLDGSIETHPLYCPPVHLFAPKGTRNWQELEVLGEGVNSSPGVSALYSLYQCPYFSFLSVADFSCSWSWIRWFFLSWSSTLRC